MKIFGKEWIRPFRKIRAGIRELVKYIDPVDQKYVTTNFEDAILEDQIVITILEKETQNHMVILYQ